MSKLKHVQLFENFQSGISAGDVIVGIIHEGNDFGTFNKAEGEELYQRLMENNPDPEYLYPFKIELSGYPFENRGGRVDKLYLLFDNEKQVMGHSEFGGPAYSSDICNIYILDGYNLGLLDNEKIPIWNRDRKTYWNPEGKGDPYGEGMEDSMWAVELGSKDELVYSDQYGAKYEKVDPYKGLLGFIGEE